MVKNKIGIALTILLTVFGLTACEPKEDDPKGTFFTMQEEYNKGCSQ